MSPARMHKTGVRGIPPALPRPRVQSYYFFKGVPSRLADRKRDAEGRSAIGVLRTNRPFVTSTIV